MLKTFTLKNCVSFCFLFLGIFSLKAQNLLSTPVSIVNNLTPPQMVFTKASKGLGKTSTCGYDTVYYPYNKTSAFNAISLNASTSGNSFAQWYPAPQAITVSGFDFYAWQSAASSAVVSLTCRMYAAGTDSMPTGLPLASVVVNVDSSFGGGLLSVLRKSAVFTNPVTTTSPYVITVETSSSVNVSVISNNWSATPANGQSQWLSSVKIGTNFIRSYNINVGGIPFNADFIFLPYVSYSLTANFSRSACITGSNTITFTNTSSNVLFNPFYSVRVFQNIPQLCCLWDYGDTSGLWYTVNGLRLYNYRIPYTVTLKDTLIGWRNGCVDNISMQIPAAPPLPNANNNSPLCSGATLRLTADTIPGATYYWTGPNGFTSTLQNPTINNANLAIVGTYMVTAIIGQCSSAVATTNVSIITTPTASSNSPRCEGQSLNLSVTAITGASYSWTGPNGFTSTLQNPFITSTTMADSGTYYVSVSVAGCGLLGPFAASGTVNRIPATPTVTGNSPLCVGDNLNLTSSSFIGGTYYWSGPNGFSSVQQNPTRPNMQPSFAGTYSVSIANNNCQSLPASVTIIVNNVPTAPTASNNGPLCVGQALSLSATSIAGASYSWSGPNGFTSSLQNPIRTSLSLLDAGNYSVIATVNGCASLANTTNVAITTLTPTPVATTNGPLCPGQNLQLSASNILNASYSWTGPNSFTSTQQNPFINGVSTLNAGIYSVTATTAGCGASLQGNVSLAVNSLPASPIVGNNGPVCEGQSINLTASTISGATYNWSGPNGFSSNDQNPIITNATSSKSGQYSVYVSVSGCGVSSTSNTQVITHVVPVAPLASSGGAACIGDSIKLFATATSVGPNATYTWSGPNNFYTVFKDPFIVNANSLNAGFYNVFVTDSGCASPAASTFVGIKTIPAAPIAASNSPICEGSKLLLTATNINGATYKWIGPSFLSTAQNPIANNTLSSQSGTYSVYAIVNGCISLPSNTNVVINSTPDMPTATNSGPKCIGENITLFASNVPGATYSWSGPNNFNSTLQNPVLNNVTLNQSGDYSVIAISSSCVSAPATTTLQVSTIPTPPILSSNPVNGIACSGDSIQLYASFTNGAKYEWTGPAGFNSTLQSPLLRNINAAMTGVYSATINKDGCYSAPANYNITVNDAPTTSDISGLNDVKNYETTTYTVSGSSGSTYLWIAYGGGTITAGANTNTATVKWGAANANAVIRVRETNSSNCKGAVKELFVNVKSTVGVSNTNNLLQNISIYPNPTSKLLNIKYDLPQNEYIKCEIIDVLGKTHYSDNQLIVKGSEITIDVSKLKAGIYFVNFSSAQNKKVMRLVIE